MRRAFTLIETLAVVVLMALAAATLAPVLGRGGTKAKLGEAASVIRELDRTARLLARGGEPLVVLIERGRAELVDGRTGSSLAIRELPSSVECESDDDKRVTYRIGGDGASEDLDLTLRIGQHARRVRISGLTGATIGDTP